VLPLPTPLKIYQDIIWKFVLQMKQGGAQGLWLGRIASTAGTDEPEQVVTSLKLSLPWQGCTGIREPIS
jgi:hypothetical protein